MLRTVTNFSNSTKRVPPHSWRHQTTASFGGVLLKREHGSPLSCTSLVIVEKPCESITECCRVLQLKDENVWLLLHGNAIKVHMCLAYQFITVIIKSGQGKEQNWAFLTALGDQLAWLPLTPILWLGRVLSVILDVSMNTVMYCKKYHGTFNPQP